MTAITRASTVAVTADPATGGAVEAGDRAEVDAAIAAHPGAAELARIVVAHPQRQAILHRLHETRGAAYVRQVLVALDGDGGDPEANALAKLKQVCADRELSRDDWAALEPAFAPLRGRPSAAADALLSTAALEFDDPSAIVVFDRAPIYAFLEACGYRIPRIGQYGRDRVAYLVASNRLRPAPGAKQVEAAIATLRAEHTITVERFHDVLRPLLWRMPATTTAETRQVLALYCDKSVALVPEVQRELARTLRGFGFAIDADAPRPAQADLPRLEAGHIRAADGVFDQLSRTTGRDRARVQIGVIDGGFDTRHPAIAGTVANNPADTPGNQRDDDGNGLVDDTEGFHFYTEQAALDPRDALRGIDAAGHGNSVLGIATKGTDRIEAVLVGIAPHRIGACIDYAVARGARMINCSFHLDREDQVHAFREALARHRGVLFVMAAGNDGKDLDDPASGLDPLLALQRAPAPNLLVVGASDRDGGVFSEPERGTNTGATTVDLAADRETTSATSEDGYRDNGATSQAAPNAMNAAAKCLALDPGLSPAAIRVLLRATTRASAAWAGKTASGGLLDADTAMRLAAITGLVRRGQRFDDAAATTNLPAEQQARFRTWVELVLKS